MAEPITLPPLPDNLISMSHGPFKPSLYHKGENYCVRCYTRSIYLASRQCNPHIDTDQLRARDLEVARVVLEAAANMCQNERIAFSGEEWRIRCELAEGIRALVARKGEA